MLLNLRLVDPANSEGLTGVLKIQFSALRNFCKPSFTLVNCGFPKNASLET